ncbi:MULTISPECIES: TonB-dependent receptor [Microbulbifer]|uniref:TonB-dependent receptor n=1 Tax=Microbulbifer celer TaxID=435905 RepID=A0ABW3U9L2_9GAMM|nr:MULTISPECIES: TonB-dependent receptor [Microbulbifer]UFN57331.1 TonB-dependent receptor [Microbulbifer celer]
MANYKIKPLVLAMAFTAPVMAQEPITETEAQTTGDATLEELTVTGFRQSLERALDTKRDSANNTDSIIAEDMGKMPDLNLAESLQRVPGVAISREGGEGRKITVRGLGPGFSRTTLNGMEVPSSTGGLDSSGGVNRGRDFDFNVFASELFNQITIHKSPIASVEEGGLASTVELSTARPFDNPGQQVAFSGQMMADSFAGEDNPRLTGLYSNTFMDDRLGVLVSAAYSERTVRQEGFGSVRWTSPVANGQSWANGDSDVTINGTPNPGANNPGEDVAADSSLDYMWTPRLPRMDSFNRDQERLGLTSSVQFRPTDSMEFSLDVLTSNLKADVTSYNYFAQFRNTYDQISPSSVTLDPTGRYIVAGEFDNVTPRSESRGQFSETDFTQVVLSGQFDIADNMVLDLMYGNATSEHTEDQLRFNQTAAEGHGFSYSFEKDKNIAEMDYGFDILDASNYVWSGPTLRRDIVERENDTLRADFTIEGDSSSIKTGLIWNSRAVASERWDAININEDLNGAVVDANLATSLGSVVGDYADGIDAPSGYPNTWLVADYDAAAAAWGVGDWALNEDDSSTYDIEEETLGGYVEANVYTQLLGLPFTVNSGLRIVDTKVTSRGVSSDGEGGFAPVEREGSYTEILPSANFVLELEQDLLLRLGIARNMSRPGLGSLAGTVSVTPINGNVSIGNPNLEPVRANSADLGLEWYFAEESVLALTLFHKQIESFTTGETLENQTLPADIRAIVAARPEYDPSSPLYEPNAIHPDDDGWNISTSVNGEGADLNGYELSYQQPLRFLPGWASNFGVLANYTHVQSRADFGNGVRGSLEGLSENSYNAGVYYETDLFGGRLMLNSRDDYVTDQTGSNGNASHGTTGPTRLDMSAFYNVTDYATITLEAINLTNEAERLYTTGPLGDMDLVREYNSTGREVLVGLRVNF